MGPALPLYLSDNGDICIESGGKICSKFVQFVEMSTKSMDNQFVHDFEDQIVNFHWIQCYKEKRKLGLGHFFRCGRGEHFFFFYINVAQLYNRVSVFCFIPAWFCTDLDRRVGHNTTASSDYDCPVDSEKQLLS